MKNTPLITALLFETAMLAGAVDFYTPVSVTTTNSVEFFPITNLIEGPDVGYDAAEPHDAISGAHTWVTDAPFGFPADYIANHGPVTIVLDLGADSDLSEISVWGYAATNANGVKEFQLRFATEAEGDAGFGTSITYNPTFTAILDPVPRQSSLFDRVVRARYVEFNCTDNYFSGTGTGSNGQPAGGDRVGLGEIAFEHFVSSPAPHLVAPASLPIPPTLQATNATITLQNTGQLPLTITAATFSGPGAAAFSVVSRPTTLLNLQTGDVVIHYTPGAPSGDVTATLTIASNDPNSPNTGVPITVSSPLPHLVSPASLTIPPTTQATDATITLQNTGLLPLTITAATFSGANATAFSVVSRPTTLTNLQTGDVVIHFTPGALSGGVSATLTVASNDPNSPATDIPITTSVPPPPVDFFPIAGVTSSTQGSDFFAVENLIQGPGVGFNATFPHDQLGGGQPDRWVTTACGFPCDYLDSNPPPVIILDLGQNRTLQEIDVWGYTAANANGVKEFALRFATDAEGIANFGTSITYNPDFLIDQNDDVRRFPFAFDLPVTARYVEFTCVDNFFVFPGDGSAPGSQPGGDRVGLGEIAFPIAATVSPAVPLAITVIQRNAATRTITLTFTSEAGKTYTIQRSTDLATWTDLADAVPATGATTDYTDSDIVAADHVYFYRVTRP